MNIVELDNADYTDRKGKERTLSFPFGSLQLRLSASSWEDLVPGSALAPSREHALSAHRGAAESRHQRECCDGSSWVRSTLAQERVWEPASQLAIQNYLGIHPQAAYTAMCSNSCGECTS